MIEHNPIEEYIFWKNFIDKKLQQERSIPRVLYDVLDHAETDMMYYLMNKHDIFSVNNEAKKLIH